MACHEYKNWWMSLAAVLIFFGSCNSDPKLIMDRRGSESFCDHLKCWNNCRLDNAMSISAISVYNITHPQVITQLANVTRDGSRAEINQLFKRVINASGIMDGLNANLSINFKNPQDCEFGSFLCELEYVDVNGEKQLMKAVDKASSSNKSTCSSINSQMSNLTEKVEDNTRQMSSLRENNSALSTELSELNENNKNLTNELSALRQDNTVQSAELSVVRQDITAVLDKLLVLTNYNTNLSIELSALRQNYSNLSTELIALRQINITLSTEAADRRQENEGISGDFSNEEISTQMSALIQDNTTVSSKLAELKQGYTALFTELAHLSKHNTVLSAELENLRQNDTAIYTELSALSQNDTDQSIQIADLKENNTGLSTELSDLRQQNANLLLQFQNLSSQVSQIQNNLANVKTSSSTTVTTTTPASTGITTTAMGRECSRGMSHSSPRVKFLLWGQIPSLCDTETDGGGWVIIQRRAKGDVDFYKDWESYKRGFGTPDTDFWLGNEVIHNLTSQGYNKLRVDMIFKQKQYHAQYNVFSVDNEQQNYRLTVSGYRGTTGDGLSYHTNTKFSTYDRDNDKSSSRHCAFEVRGAWWHNACYYSNLNGAWGVNNKTGIIWAHLAYTTPLDLTEIKVRL